MSQLDGKKIAILATDGFEQSELFEPKQALEAAGAAVEVVSPAEGSQIKAWHKQDWGKTVAVDRPVDQARADDYDALVLPGGVMNPDKLRTKPEAVALVQAFAKAGKPVAAICHGPWLLVEAGIVDGKRVTSWPSLQTDLRNAGARWEDSEVVEDGHLITSRKPDDIPAFNAAVIRAVS